MNEISTAQNVFMRDRVKDKVQRFCEAPRWHQKPALVGHMTIVFLVALAAVNMLALSPIG